ncbi:MAG: transglycosylase domain-containing protein [bacterium]|nr:transglycosylase domain-containing protein [bacterium]
MKLPAPDEKKALSTLGHILVAIFGILGGLFKTMLHILTVCLILGACIGLFIYAKVKPQIDHAQELAYDKLAQMERSDFSMLSDTEIFDKDGNRIGLINAGHYEYVPIQEISLNLQNAYIAQEDRRFKTHHGVDWIATARAGLALIKHRGSITQGGSTITQQVIKNTYLTQEQTFSRKLIEILLAPAVEQKFSKADIMEFYCNTNFYGHQCYGVQAASRYYFGKDAADLEVYEAAVLVGISNSPSAYDPVRHPEASLEKRNEVLQSMLEVGYLSEAEYESCSQMPLQIVQEEAEGTDENYQSSYAIHCAALELMKLDGFSFRYTFENKEDYDSYMENYSDLYNEKTDSIRAGGYKIYTSLDSNIQAVLQSNLDNTLASYTELQENGKYALQGAAVIVDNQSNYVVAIVGGRGEEDAYNRAYLSARQPGSTIKPLLDYGPAFDTGEYYPSRIMNDHKWENGPSNSGGSYRGNVTVREALNRSLNTVAWQVLEDIGVSFGLSYLGEMEFQKISYIDNDVLSLSIGGFTNGLRVVDMAKGYSTLANQGIYNDRTCIKSIQHEHDGDLTKNMKTSTKQVYSKDTAFILTDVLKGTLTEAYGTGRGLSLARQMPAAGKTGTTNDSKDTWFCGYSRYYTGAVWVGYDTPRAMPGVYGSTYAGKIWKAVMDAIHENLSPLDWEQPETVIAAPYDHSSGKRIQSSATETSDSSSQTETETSDASVSSNGLHSPRIAGQTDYFSTTTELQAQISVHEKEQRALIQKVEEGLDSFESLTISTVEDVYTVQNRYKELSSQLQLLDGGSERSELFQRTEQKYQEFETIIEEMSDTIRIYEEQQAKKQAEAQAQKEKEAEEERKELEIQSKRNDFLMALTELEELEYQPLNAQQLAQEAIDKLYALEGDNEVSTYQSRLSAAISRISTLPTAQEWEREQAALRESESAAARDQMNSATSQLENQLNREQQSWNRNTPAGPAGGSSSGQATIIPGNQRN